MSEQEIAESKCREIYGEAQIFFDQIQRSENYGFKILSAPPLLRPEILFIGYQPGGGAADYKRETERESDKRWPTMCEYADQEWSLAKQMRRMFEKKFLERCVAMNAIFLRAPTIRDYKRIVRDRQKEIEKFCLPRVGQIVEAIDPKMIVAVGFRTLELFGPTMPDLTNEKGRTLTRTGKIGGRAAIAILHLSGARISKLDRERIRERINGCAAEREC